MDRFCKTCWQTEVYYTRWDFGSYIFTSHYVTMSFILNLLSSFSYHFYPIGYFRRQGGIIWYQRTRKKTPPTRYDRLLHPVLSVEFYCGWIELEQGRVSWSRKFLPYIADYIAFYMGLNIKEDTDSTSFPKRLDKTRNNRRRHNKG